MVRIVGMVPYHRGRQGGGRGGTPLDPRDQAPAAVVVGPTPPPRPHPGVGVGSVGMSLGLELPRGSLVDGMLRGWMRIAVA